MSDEINEDWIVTGEGEMLKKTSPIEVEDQEQNVSDSVIIPREVWKVIEDQAASLKAKDQQVNEVIALLKEQIKRGEDAADQHRAAPGAALG